MKKLKEIQEEIKEDCGNICARRNGFDSCIACMEKEAQQKTFNECITAFRELIEKFARGGDVDKRKVLFQFTDKDFFWLFSELPEVKDVN